MLGHVSRLTLATASLTLMGAQAGLALDPDAFSARLSAYAEILGIGISAGSARVEGTTITLSDFTFLVPGTPPADWPGAVVFEAVTETEDGGYHAARVTADDIDVLVEDPEEEVTIGFVLRNMSMEDFVLPGAPDIEDAIYSSYTMFSRAEAGPMIVSVDGEPAVEIEALAFWAEADETLTDLRSGFAITGIRSAVAVPDPATGEPIAALDEETVDMEIRGESVWTPQTGVLDLTDLSIVAQDLGRLDASAVLTGYTPEFNREIIEINQTMLPLDAAVTPEDLEALDEAMFAHFATLGLGALTLRYEDDSLLHAILDVLAEQQGTDRETLSTGLVFMAPLFLLGIEDLELRAAVNNAIGAFLGDPRNFTLSIATDEPVPLAEFFGREDQLFAIPDSAQVEISVND